MLTEPVGGVPSTSTVTPVAGVSTLDAASVARDLMLYNPSGGRGQEYNHELVPDAWCHVAPPSVDTSTPETPEPEPSDDAPFTEYVPSAPGLITPPSGSEMDDKGAVL